MNLVALVRLQSGIRGELERPAAARLDAVLAVRFLLHGEERGLRLEPERDAVERPARKPVAHAVFTEDRADLHEMTGNVFDRVVNGESAGADPVVIAGGDREQRRRRF